MNFSSIFTKARKSETMLMLNDNNKFEGFWQEGRHWVVAALI